MKEFDVVIIGSGLGGLTAGATLSKHGKKVLLLEQHYIPGGCATTFKRKDLIMEVGLHEMDGFYGNTTKNKVFDFLDIHKNIELLKVPEFFNLSYSDNSFTFPEGELPAQEALCEKFPSQIKGINAFFKLMKGVHNETAKLPREQWKIKLLYPLLPFLFPNVAKTSLTTVGKWLDKHINDDELKLVLCGNILYYSDNPYNMTMLYFANAQASYIFGGGYYIKGGSQKLSDYLVSVIESNGGRVLLGKRVDEILIDNDKACGVQYVDSFNYSSKPQRVFASKIIANSAISNVIEMLPDQYKEKLENKTKKLKASVALISIYMGFSKDLKNLGVKNYSTFIQGNGLEKLKDLKSNFRGPWDNKSFVFVDYSQIDSGLTPEGKSFGVICAADYIKEWEGLSQEEYKDKKDRVAQLFIQRLSKKFPEIMEHLEFYEVGTSKTIQRYTSNYKGTPYGWSQTRSQSGLGRLASKSPVKNLYFASAWTFPGGGFSAAMISGYSCADKLKSKIKANNHTGKELIDERVVKLKEKRLIADNTLELTIEKYDGFDFKAGQYAVLAIKDPKYKELDILHRPLSIASHPNSDVLKFAMRTSNSAYKRSCLEMELGDEFVLYGPMGDFTIKDKNKPIVFLISGIGITPVIPMLEELANNGLSKSVSLLYSNKTKEQTAYHDYFSNLSNPNFHYLPIFTKTQQRISNKELREISEYKNCDYYIVGTSEFIKGMKQLLLNEEIPKEQINVDDFG